MGFDEVWHSIKDFFGHVIQNLFGESPAEVAHDAAIILRDAMTAFLRNLLAAGVKDGAALIVELAEISNQVNVTDGSASEKFVSFQSAAKTAFQRAGGDLEHDAVTSIFNTATEIFHQPAVAERVGAPMPSE